MILALNALLKFNAHSLLILQWASTMSVQNLYLMQMIWDRAEHYLFWIDGENSFDRFLAEKSAGILISTSLSSAHKLAADLNLHIAGEVLLNIDEVLLTLMQTEKIKILSSSEFKSILDVWNMINDLARSMDLKIPPYGLEKRQLIHKCYFKVFEGADILEDAINDKGQMLSMSRRERIIIKKYLLKAWKHICKKGKWHPF